MFRCWICATITLYFVTVLMFLSVPSESDGATGVKVAPKPVVVTTQAESPLKTYKKRWAAYGKFLKHYLGDVKGQGIEKRYIPPAMVLGEDAPKKIDKWITDDVVAWDVKKEINTRYPQIQKDKELFDKTVVTWRGERARLRHEQFENYYRALIWKVAQNMTVDEWLKLDLKDDTIRSVAGGLGDAFPHGSIQDIVSKGYDRIEKMPMKTPEQKVARERMLAAVKQREAVFKKSK